MPLADDEYLRRETWTLQEAAYLLAGDDPADDPLASLHVTNPAVGGRPAHFYANLKDATDMRTLLYVGERSGRIADRRVRPWDAIQWARTRGDSVPSYLDAVPEPRSEPQPAERPLATTELHVSKKLATLHQTARKFWGNASRDDRTTHPTNVEVAAWLEGHGFARVLAKKGATIIRPEWAGTGRKPDN